MDVITYLCRGESYSELVKEALCKVWITHLFIRNVSGATVEVCEGINNFVSHIIGYVITNPWRDWNWSILVKGALDIKQSRQSTDIKDNISKPLLVLL